MVRGLKILLFSSLVGLLLVEANLYDPMVAFVCNKGAMHMGPEKGWQADQHTSCLESKELILDYCRKVYPLLDVRNIVETTFPMVIKGWCPLGKPHCDEPDTFNVQPYRCLTGPFQGDTLVVPKGCRFAYKHHNDTCTSFDKWKDTASTHCSEELSLELSDLGMLVPCGVDLFSGVEFVCCPQGVTDTDLVTLSVPLEGPKIEVKVGYRSDSDEEDEQKGVVSRYMDMNPTDGMYRDEHTLFEGAKKHQLSIDHSRISKLLNGWEAERQKLMELMDTDAEEAEKENKEISEKLQKDYISLQSSEERELQQMDAVHQQHVQTNLNSKKRMVMQKLAGEIRLQSYNVGRIGGLLQQYIGAEEKDARHCLKHYQKIKSRDSLAARDLLNATIEHISLISLRINQSIDLLDSIKDKDLVDKIKAITRSWLSQTYPPLYKTINQLKADYQEELPHKPAATPVTVTSEKPTHSTAKSNMYKVYADKLSKTGFVKTANPSGGEDNSIGEQSDSASQQTSEEDIKVKDVGGFEHQGAIHMYEIFGIFAAALVVIILLALFIGCAASNKNRRHRGGHRKLSNMYLQVSEESAALSPEDRHIAAMQNGYENPTYKLLEDKMHI